MGAFEIRQATTRDAEVLVDLRERMLLEMGCQRDAKLDSLRELSVPWTRDAIAQQRAAGFVAETDGCVVGGATMSLIVTQPQLNAQTGRIGQIYGVYVHPEHRGQRIATRLVEACVELAREEWGCELATLHAAQKARAIYYRIGFDDSPEMRLFLQGQVPVAPAWSNAAEALRRED